MRWGACGISVVFVLLFVSVGASDAAPPIRVGSKRFVESYLLSEMVTQLIQAEGAPAEHALGLGGTAVVFRALEDHSIDVYPEYSGTLALTVVKNGEADLASLRRALEPRGLKVSPSLGFENTYALAVSRATATRVSLRKLSDLAAHPELRVALSQEFAGRSDGWPGLSARYGLSPQRLSAMDHALAYEAISRGDADVIDVYTTDAKIARFDLVTLEDDRHFFPAYECVLVYRADLETRVPAFTRVLLRMQGSIDARRMQQLNARAELDGVPFVRVAADFLGGISSTERPPARAKIVRGTIDVVIQHGPRHVMLVAISLLMSILLGVPLGILAYGRRRTGAAILGVAGVLQTIPSLALFCFLIPLLGIGALPAIAALFLYGLLPIVRNTHAGLASIPSEQREAALALGLSPVERLRYVEIPLASRTILAGIKTSAVVGVGSATIAAFIGAGGFGEAISTGLSLNDVPTILEGAIPSAVLALMVEALFLGIERLVVPPGLRASRETQ